MRAPSIGAPARRRAAFFATAAMAAAYLMFFLLHAPKGSYDADGWFLLATGRQIVESGIPRENPFSVVPGLRIVVQQWLHDVLLYAAYAVGGYAAMDAFQFVLLALVCTALWAAVRFLSRGRMPLHVALAVSIAAVAAFRGYFTVRPMPWSVMALIAVVCAMVRARRSANPIWYLVLPAVVLVHVQLQASMMPLDILVAAALLLPDCLGDIRSPDKRRAYLADRRILLLMILLACAASLMNPYGIEGATYLFQSLGEASYGNYIAEMQSPFTSQGPLFAASYLAPLLIAVVACHAANRVLPAPATAVLLLGGVVAAVSSARSIWIYAVVCALSCALAYSGSCGEGASDGGSAAADAPLHLSSLNRAAMLAGPVLFAALALALPNAAVAAGVYRPASNETESGRGSSWSYYETYARPLTDELARLPEGSRVLVDDGVTASFMEWAGLPVVFDYRPEIWGPRISGVEGYRPYRDFVRAAHGEDSWTDYVTEGGWDAMLVRAKGADAYEALPGWMVQSRNAAFALIVPE